MKKFKADCTDKNIENVKMVCGVIINTPWRNGTDGRGSECAKSILKQLPSGGLDDETYLQLVRWCNMKNYIPIVEGYFAQIHRKLYGPVPERK